eukprot:GHVU01117458.1.p1 GENE.GHVU01117458.1~~GHVU01117458.1.p1  ORF type:complete len:273 (-),score=30.30 GHVU01117458.1:1876-2694(-)
MRMDVCLCIRWWSLLTVVDWLLTHQEKIQYLLKSKKDSEAEQVYWGQLILLRKMLMPINSCSKTLQKCSGSLQQQQHFLTSLSDSIAGAFSIKSEEQVGEDDVSDVESVPGAGDPSIPPELRIPPKDVPVVSLSSQGFPTSTLGDLVLDHTTMWKDCCSHDVRVSEAVGLLPGGAVVGLRLATNKFAPCVLTFLRRLRRINPTRRGKSLRGTDDPTIPVLPLDIAEMENVAFQVCVCVGERVNVCAGVWVSLSECIPRDGLGLLNAMRPGSW